MLVGRQLLNTGPGHLVCLGKTRNPNGSAGPTGWGLDSKGCEQVNVISQCIYLKKGQSKSLACAIHELQDLTLQVLCSTTEPLPGCWGGLLTPHVTCVSEKCFFIYESLGFLYL